MKAADIRELCRGGRAGAHRRAGRGAFPVAVPERDGAPWKSPLRLRVLRKDIARLHTVLNEKKRKAAARRSDQVTTPQTNGAARLMRKSRVGVVISDKMQKTIVVAIERRVAHPVYGKMMTRTTTLKAHDEENSAKTGDTVRIMETRPMSKDKRWRVVEIVERAR